MVLGEFEEEGTTVGDPLLVDKLMYKHYAQLLMLLNLPTNRRIHIRLIIKFNLWHSISEILLSALQMFFKGA